MKEIVARRDAANAYRLWYVLTVESWLQSRPGQFQNQGVVP